MPSSTRSRISVSLRLNGGSASTSVASRRPSSARGRSSPNWSPTDGAIAVHDRDDQQERAEHRARGGERVGRALALQPAHHRQQQRAGQQRDDDRQDDDVQVDQRVEHDAGRGDDDEEAPARRRRGAVPPRERVVAVPRSRSARPVRARGRDCSRPRTRSRSSQEHEHRADDRADDAAEVELVVVADAESVREQGPADERADDADAARCRRSPWILAGKSARPRYPATMPMTMAAISSPIMAGGRTPAEQGKRRPVTRVTGVIGRRATRRGRTSSVGRASARMPITSLACFANELQGIQPLQPRGRGRADRRPPRHAAAVRGYRGSARAGRASRPNW